MNTEIAIQHPENTELSFGSKAGFEHIQRVAQLFASSQLVPQAFQGNLPNCVIALDMAARMGASPFAVIQNLNIIHGRPSFSSQYLIAAVNSCGRFLPIRFHVEGEGDGKSCIAWTIEKAVAREFTALLGKLVTLPSARAQAEVPFIEGPPVSIEMARAEGWLGKNGSKWKTMPDLMLRYRAAAFFARLYAPELTMGIRPTEEVIDVEGEDITSRVEVTSTTVDSAPAATTPAVTRVRKGVSKADPKPVEATAPAATVEPAPAVTPTPSLETPPAPAAEPAKSAPAADPVTPAVETTTVRCEFTRIVQRTPVAGKADACEVELTGEYAGKAFFVGTIAQLPDIGQIADVVIEKRFNADKTRSAHFIHSATLLA